MLHRFHDRFGTAGVVIGVIALIAALGGTALAAGGLTGPQEKQVKKIAKKYAGKPGAPGATGPAGPAGTNGTNGKDGTNGTNGANGKNVVTGTATSTPSGECPTVGGATVEVEGEAATKKHVCNGSPWTAGGTLPPGKTETGAWGTVFDSSGKGVAALSVPIHLAAPIAAANIHVLVDAATNPACDDGNAADGAPSSRNPEAASGHACIWTTSGFGTAYSPVAVIPAGGGFLSGESIGVAGALLVFFGGTAGDIASGSFAVTG